MRTLREMAGDAPICMFYFYSDDCAPCHTLRQKLKELFENEFPDIPFHLLEGKSNTELMQHHMIVSFPTAVLWADGREYRRYSVYTSVAAIREDLLRLRELMA